MAITVTLLTSGDTSNLITSLSFVSILFSLIFGLFSIYVPKFIKNNTSIFTFILWVIINIAFSFSSLSVNHSSLFSIGILLAILALFVIILFYIFNKSFRPILLIYFAKKPNPINERQYTIANKIPIIPDEEPN